MEQVGRFEKATFAAGCFRYGEAAFRNTEWISEPVAGYTGGSSMDPSYEEVESGTTGHGEAGGILFNPAIVA